MGSQFAQIVSPVMIGRHSELGALEEALYGAQQGQGRCIFIAGEAGVGKSRLLHEVRQRALREGFVVLQGDCFEQDVSFPYSLWINALRGFLAWRSASEIRERIGPLAAEFVKLLPELALILPDVQASPSLDPESEKRRLFEALARFAVQLAAAAPLLIALEDLHWSDETSLDLLHTFMQRAAGRPIMLIATYRNEERPPQLAHFLAEVNRQRMADELVLAPLTRDQTSEIIAAILKLERQPGDEFLDLIMRRTEGNPFFIEEVLKTLSETGLAPSEAKGMSAAGTWKRKSMQDLQVPAGVHDAVHRRMDRVDPETRRILTLAAVAGQRFSLELLREVSGRNERELLLAIKELLGAQFVVEESADQFAFRHALTREAVYASLLLRERQALHRLVGETMERLWEATSDARIGELAHHFYQAAIWDKAIEYSWRAGDQAQRLFAPREALAHFSRALDAAERVQITPSSSIPRARAHVLELLGEFDAARVDYENALELARREEDRGSEWATLIDLGFLWQSRDWLRAGEYFERAFDLATSLEETPLVARSLNRLGNWRWNRGQPRVGLSYHRQALELFQQLNDRRGMAQTLELMGFASYGLGEVVQGAGYCEQAVPILRELDDRQGLVNALGTLALRARLDTEVLGNVDLHRLAGLAESALEVARSCGYRKGEADASAKAAVCLCRAGDYGRGLEHLRRAWAIAEEIEHRELLTTVHIAWGLELYLGLLAAAQARERLEAAVALAHELKSVSLTFIAAARLVSACILQDDLARAQSLLDGLLPSDLPDVPDTMMLERGCWAGRAELELAHGNPARSLEIIAWLLAGTANLQEYGPYAVPRLTHLRANALVALGRTEEATAELRGALAVAGAQGQRPMLWRMHADLGRALRSMGRREDAQEHFWSARSIIQELADSLPDGALRDNFTRQALAALPVAPAFTPRRAAMKELGGLTERERQVAVLIAQGKSNREIASTLVITVRTVEAHITRILTKLSLKSRSEIAVWAVAKGLARPPA